VLPVPVLLFDGTFDLLHRDRLAVNRGCRFVAGCRGICSAPVQPAKSTADPTNVVRERIMVNDLCTLESSSFFYIFRSLGLDRLRFNLL
jgi:hypothetical protein